MRKFVSGVLATLVFMSAMFVFTADADILDFIPSIV